MDTPIAESPPRTFLERAEWLEAVKADKSAPVGLRKDPLDSQVRRRHLAAAEIKALNLEDDEPEEGYAFLWTMSTERQDRDRDIIMADGWRWDDFLRTGAGPILLAHASWTVPIAKMPRVSMEGGRLTGVIVFPTMAQSPDNQLAHCCRQMIAFGGLSSGSVGFFPLEWVFDEDIKGIRFRKQDLLEFSPCAVPSNPDAVRRAKAAGINVGPLRTWAEQVLDQMAAEEKTADVLTRVWKAASPARVFIEGAGGVLVPVERTLESADPVEAATATEPELEAGEPVEVPPAEQAADATKAADVEHPADDPQTAALKALAAEAGCTINEVLDLCAEAAEEAADELYIARKTPLTGRVPA